MQSFGLIGTDAMYDLLGPWFYEWWAGLPRGTRVALAVVVLASGGIGGLFFPSSWLIWGPAAIAGAVMLMAA